MPKKQYVQKMNLQFRPETIEPVMQQEIQKYLDNEEAEFPLWVLDFMCHQNKEATIECFDNTLRKYEQLFFEEALPIIFESRLKIIQKE